jgi:F-type H+-transporting ATPase subunit gamma
MAHIREIKKRIKVAQNIQQITRAMAMVAAVRLRRAQEKVVAVRAYTERLAALVSRMAPDPAEGEHPLFAPRRAAMNILLVPITADKGLCGSYNTNIVRRTVAAMGAMPQGRVTLFPVGKKGYDYFRRINAPMAGYRFNLVRSPKYREAVLAAQAMGEAFLSGRYDEVHIIYNRFVSAAHQVAEMERFLPISLPRTEGGDGGVIMEPSRRALVDALAEEWMKARAYQYILEAAVGELGARQTAMDAATDNASEIIASQTLALNRARQNAITMEILDIVNGAEAMK